MGMKLSVFCLLLVSLSASALSLKIGVLAPDGTTWTKNLKRMAKEIQEATAGEIEFKIFYGGAAGDEPDVLRKIRIGQMHGGIFTGKTLGELHGDIRLIEVPFTFHHDQTKAFSVLKSFTGSFDKGLEKKGFKSLGFYEVGLVYLVSTKKAINLEQLKGIKVWAWQGDELVRALVETLELVSVPLAIPDVLSSFSTGIIEAAYASPLAILALQWQTKIKYLVDFPVAYSVASLLIDQKVWKKISLTHKRKIEKISEKYINLSNTSTAEENAQALTSLKKLGIEFVNFSQQDLKLGTGIRQKVLKKLVGPMFSVGGLEKFEKELLKQQKEETKDLIKEMKASEKSTT